MTARRTRGERAGLTRARVLDAALALIDRDGLAALSMRRLGEELGVEAMTLYHHVPNKDALLDGLVERVLDEATPASRPGTAWSDALRERAWALRASLLRHPAVVPLVPTRPAATPAVLRAVEDGLAQLSAAGFPLGRALDLLNALAVFVVGHVAAEVGTAPVAAAARPGSTAWLAELDAYPLLQRAARDGAGTSDEERFASAVDALLAGFAA